MSVVRFRLWAPLRGASLRKSLTPSVIKTRNTLKIQSSDHRDAAHHRSLQNERCPEPPARRRNRHPESAQR